MNLTVSEEQEHMALIAWARWQSKQMPELSLLYHTPNGGSRHMLEAKKLKRMGVLPGVFDLFLPVPRGPFHGLYLEMKSGRGKPSPAQSDFQHRVLMQGYCALIAYSFEEAKQFLLTYLEQEAPS
jgi:hypothetical protein